MPPTVSPTLFDMAFAFWLKTPEVLSFFAETMERRGNDQALDGAKIGPPKTQKALTNQGFEDGGSVEIRTLG